MKTANVSCVSEVTEPALMKLHKNSLENMVVS